jgi:DNA-binding CsgD family transcriptional regulator
MTLLGHFSYAPTGSAGSRPARQYMSLPLPTHAMNQPIPEKLTAKEAEVLKLLGEGLTTKEIASHFHLSAETVANHRKHICAKLHLHSTAALIAYAARLVKS